MSEAPSWAIQRHVGDAFRLHGMEPRPGTQRTVWIMTVDRPAVVIGSTQDDGRLRHDRLAELGIDLVRRGGGGGAVLLLPTESIWLDLVLDRADPLVCDDVQRSFHWVGALWVRALASLGVDAAFHRGAPRRTRWSDQICFAGLGAGEVVIDGCKVVGLSQRRTRSWVRIQCLTQRVWPGEELLDLFDLTDDELADARGSIAAAPAEVGASSLVRAVLDQLPT